ncbi:uncharacterized protein DDB_G0284459 isoform X2 [Agrilus planipennis]|uniref:Uncharacterized protein DDB_G0284459 isoform X2 n=1 Tax=Agrilus planipennis TaxID=224129 RepID=A0A1W4X2Q9_AGRPL|nr:uncharacterized protein DDB_G0284459 isoform X2 [Agrilus planipennis]
MDCWYQENEKENSNKRNSNTQYLPSKCRTTRPPPPTPATNPLQFVKVAPPPLIQKAQEQVKKVELVKSVRKDFKEDEEDWQQNLDNWKSSRRKRQEHIIERVVEVKKITQEEQDKGRKKSKTFNEILEERSKRGYRLKLPIYEDEDSDFTSYVGSSKSQTDVSKEVKKEEHEKVELSDKSIQNNNEDNEESQRKEDSQLEKEKNVRKNYFQCNFDNEKTIKDEISSQISLSNEKPKTISSESFIDSKFINNNDNKFGKSNQEVISSSLDNMQQYTYESAIEGYRSRIKSKIKIDESIFNKPSEYKPIAKVDVPIPKGVLFKRKEIFEVEKPIAIGHLESLTSKRLSEDFANSQSIKERLKSLEKCTEQSLTRNIERDPTGIKWNNPSNDENDNKTIKTETITQSVEEENLKSRTKQNDKSNVRHEERTTRVERSFSPETELYMNKLNVFSKDLDDLLEKTGNRIAPNDISNGFYESPNPSLLGDGIGTASSDREDSGIHTADVSCSVSQADESTYEVEDSDFLSPTALNRSQKFDVETEIHELNNENEQKNENIEPNEIKNDIATAHSEIKRTNNKELTAKTKYFLEQLQKEAAIDLELERKWKLTTNVMTRSPTSETTTDLKKVEPIISNRSEKDTHANANTNTPLILDYIDELELSNSPLAPPKAVEPPKEKPPPPPPLDQEDYQEKAKAFNSTKRIKKEIYVKRSSFLGLDEPTDDQIDPDISIERPPDINRFLQEESQMEKCLYRKLHGSREMISEVESQDSGLESERGRLSSDTWCSNGTSAHFRQDSETNSVTSEEDEVTRKEREIIELVEKEEKSKTAITNLEKGDLESIHYRRRRNFPLCNEYYPVDAGSSTTYCNSTLSDTDLEVMRVEQELNRLERKHVESQNYMLAQCGSPSRSQCRNSLENICDTDACSPYATAENYRKSLPDLYHDYKPSSTNCSYRKSMPDINQTPYLSFKKHESIPMYALEYRKSMPELEGIYPRPAITSHLKEAYPSNCENKQAYIECVEPPNMGGKMKLKQPVSKHEAHALSAAPKQKHIPNDIWIQPKVNTETKNYNQHWLLQEAELRRIEEHQKNRGHQGHLKWQLPARPEQQHIPDPIIETLTHRLQNRTGENRRQFLRRPQPTLGNKDCNRFVYLTHDHNLNHGVSKSYSSPLHLQESQNQLLSVSGKKKCSYCGIELGRGAAMIIESLALFYHMECFKCCVCHVQLGDGLMGTDVRVRNQKLHCHNCYSSDDGVKFSCV